MALTALLWFTFAYFSQGGAANQNSRFALTRAIVEQGTLRIDAFASTTFDIASVQGHHYSDKAPGLALLAVPAHALYVAFLGVPSSSDAVRAALHWATVMSVSLASALAGGLLYLLLISRGYSRGVTMLVVLGWQLATPAFAYSTLFYGHQLAAALVVMAMAVIELPSKGPMGFGRGAMLGILLGSLVATEYPTAILVPLIVAQARPWTNRQILLGGAAGSSIAFGGLALLHTLCFGSPWGAGYSSLKSPEFARTIATGWMGFQAPSLDAIIGLLWSEARGLLPAAPWLLLSLLGLILLWRRGQRWRAAWLGLASLLPLLLVSGFARWDGGAAFGPRHLTYVLPLMAMLTAEPLSRISAWSSTPRLAMAVAVGTLLLAGHFICLAAVSVMPELPDQPAWVPFDGKAYQADPAHPLTQFLLPLFFQGRMSVKALEPNGRFGVSYLSPGHDQDAYNLGEHWLGIRGKVSLLPLAGLWLSAALGIGWWWRKRGPRSRAA